MSTTAPTPAVEKLSFISKLDTDVVDVAKKIKDGLAAAGGDAVKVASFIQSNASEISALAGLAGPSAAGATAVGLNLLNIVINAVKDAGSAAGANGLSVSLDQATIADVKAVIAAIEKI